MQNNFTLWIPTKNRSQFLLRTLKYYKKTNFKGHIFIGDSSEGEEKEKNSDNIKKYAKDLSIYYSLYPNTSTGHVSSQLVPQIETDFSSFLSDDDIIITPSIDLAIKKLENDNSLIGVSGKALLFQVEDSQPFGNLLNTSTYELGYFDNNNSIDRLKKIFSSVKSINMCINRTENHRAVFQQVSKLSKLHSSYIYEELLGCAIMSIRGKIIHLPNLFLCRHGHVNQAYFGYNFFDWLTDKDWASSFEILQQTAINEITSSENITENEAKKLFNNFFWIYLRSQINNSKSSSNIKNINYFSEYLKKINFIKLFARYVKNFYYWKISYRYKSLINNFSLPALRNQNSPYYDDFNSLYNVVTKKI
jgi:glycosyltransferase domain-containing protein